jgi:hypothetical protein
MSFALNFKYADIGHGSHGCDRTFDSNLQSGASAWEDTGTAVGESIALFCRSGLGLHGLVSSFPGRTNELETEKDIQE